MQKKTARPTPALKPLRIAAGLTVSELAKQTGVDRTSISNFESGTRGLGPDKLKAIADRLGVSVHQITSSGNEYVPSAVLRDSAVVYEVPASRAEFVRFLDEEDLQKYLARAVADPASFPEEVYGALTRENYRRKTVEEKTGRPYTFEPRKKS